MIEGSAPHRKEELGWYTNVSFVAWCRLHLRRLVPYVSRKQTSEL